MRLTRVKITPQGPVGHRIEDDQAFGVEIQAHDFAKIDLHRVGRAHPHTPGIGIYGYQLARAHVLDRENPTLKGTICGDTDVLRLEVSNNGGNSWAKLKDYNSANFGVTVAESFDRRRSIHVYVDNGRAPSPTKVRRLYSTV